MDNDKLSLDPEIAKQWQELRKKGIVIPMQPKVLLKIDELRKSSSFQLHQLAALIRQDPGLSARILYIVNSPAYGLTKKIANIENAIIILGVDRTLNLSRAALLREALGQTNPVLEIFWRRSSIVAEITVAIAYRQRIGVNSDLAYLIGLFHACGIAVLANCLPGYGDELVNEATWAQLDEHSHKFDVDHVLVSYLVSCHWQLPGMVTESILQQRNPTSFPIEQKTHDRDTPLDLHKQHAGLISSLQLALLIYNRLSLDNRTSEWEATLENSLDTLGMSKDQFAPFA